MIYKDFKGLKLSALGLGCMRFPLAGEKDSQVDVAATAGIVARAFRNGINYFDTAWAYHGGCSETIMGNILKEYPRDSFFLASKFPGYAPENLGKAGDIFEQQLERCQVDYFDFYLLHNVTQSNIDGYMDEQYGIVDYFIEQKRQGRIRHLGFSTHGSLEVMRRFLDAYAGELEFCQIQLNYLDWDLQNARAKVALLQEYDMPVWVMEPVRGGRLAKLDEAHEAKLRSLRPEASMPEWSFRFLQSLDCVTLTLSGMSSLAQVEENTNTYAEEKPLTEQEMAVLREIAADMIRKNAVPCTACSYCVERCPQGINIPAVIKLYNEKTAYSETPGPADCLGCHNCEIVCPQGISITKVMDEAEMLI